MKKFLSSLLALAMIISIVGCAGPKPEDTVSAFLDSFINGNFEEANKYITDSDEAFYSLEDLMNENPSAYEAMMTAYKKMTYSILNSTVDGDKAQVETKITAPGLGTIFKEANMEAINIFLSKMFSEDSNEDFDENYANELLNSIIIEKLTSDTIPMITKTITINLVKEDGTWLIENEYYIYEAISGDLTDQDELDDLDDLDQSDDLDEPVDDGEDSNE